MLPPIAACPLDPRLAWANATSPLGSFRMAVMASDDLVSHEIATRGYWELRFPNQLLELAGESSRLPSTGTFLDIGANLGFYSLLFAQHGYDVLAVEPMLLNRKAIAASLCANPSLAARIRLLPLALGTRGTERIRCVVRADDRNAGNGKLSCSAEERCERAVQHPGRSLGVAAHDSSSAAHATICEPVRMSTLDELLAREQRHLAASPIVAVKIDVEGFECNVLSGGRSLLAPPHRPLAIVAEANRKQVKQCLAKFASEANYRPAVTRPTHSGGVEGDVNWVLVRQQYRQQASPLASARVGDAVHRAGEGSGGGTGGSAHQACTWSNGCCARHPGLEICKRLHEKHSKTRAAGPAGGAVSTARFHTHTGRRLYGE